MQTQKFLSIFLIVFLTLSIIPFYKAEAQTTYLKVFEQQGTTLKIPTINVADSVVSYQETKDFYQFNITLSKPPATNVFAFPIETSGLEFHYQPPLTEAKLMKDVTFVNATHALNEKGSIRHYRPPNVVGSYAVYMTDSRIGMTGKLYHIYRPLLVDAKGARSWANLTVTKNSMVVTCDSEFIAKAVYPLTIDPTIGKTDIGESGGNIYGYKSAGVRRQASEDGTVDTLNVYVPSGATGNVRLCMFDEDTNYPDAVLEESGDTATTDGQWNDISGFTISITNGDYYYFGIQQDTDEVALRYDEVGTTYYYESAYGAFDDPFTGGASSGGWEYSIFGNYTTGAAPSHTDAELSETVNLSASLETQKDMHNLFSETVTVSGSCGVVKSLTRVTGETVGVSADYLSVKTLTRTAGESSVVTSVFESSKGITQVLAELSETVSVSASLLVQKAIHVLASGVVDISAVLDTVKHLGATFIEFLETLPFTAYLEVLLPEIPLTVEVVVVIAFLALAIAVSAFAYVATRGND